MGQPRRQHIWHYTGTAGRRHRQFPVDQVAILASRIGRLMLSWLREFVPLERPPETPPRPRARNAVRRQPAGRRQSRGIFGLSLKEILVLAVILPVAAAFLLLLAKHIWPLALVLLLALVGGLWLEVKRRSNGG